MQHQHESRLAVTLQEVLIYLLVLSIFGACRSCTRTGSSARTAETGEGVSASAPTPQPASPTVDGWPGSGVRMYVRTFYM